MTQIFFTANLYSMEGQLLETGEAALSELDNAVDFVSDFVPLLPVDSEVKLTRTIGERRMESYYGKVFRGTGKLLQVTEIPSGQMKVATDLFSVNFEHPVICYVGAPKALRFNIKTAPTVTGMLRFLSPDKIKITVNDFVGEEQVLAFSLEYPGIVLHELRVQVKQRMLLKRDSAVLICEPVLLGSANAKALQNFKPAGKPTPTEPSNEI